MSNDRIVYRPDPETWLDRLVAGVVSALLIWIGIAAVIVISCKIA